VQSRSDVIGHATQGQEIRMVVQEQSVVGLDALAVGDLGLEFRKAC